MNVINICFLWTFFSPLFSSFLKLKRYTKHKAQGNIVFFRVRNGRVFLFFAFPLHSFKCLSIHEWLHMWYRSDSIAHRNIHFFFTCKNCLQSIPLSNETESNSENKLRFDFHSLRATNVCDCDYDCESDLNVNFNFIRTNNRKNLRLLNSMRLRFYFCFLFRPNIILHHHRYIIT